MNENLTPPSHMSTSNNTALFPQEVMREIDAWNGVPNTGHTTHSAADYARYVRRAGEDALFKGRKDAHLTASAIMLSEDLSQTLLVFHKKAQMWLQPGGHLEEDDLSLREAALREVREETGVSDFVGVIPTPADINVHQLGDGFSGCREHWDIGFAVIASTQARLHISDESAGLRWFAVDALPEDTDVAPRVAAAISAVRRHHSERA
ncbi:NUDIX domain-containing protein [Arcanobacterium canis]